MTLDRTFSTPPPSVPGHELVRSLSSDILELILLPTEQCNFRCTYCYEDFSIGRMRPETVASVKRLVDGSIDRLRVLKVSWFGGEPLAALDIVDDLSDYISRACSENRVVIYTASMTTNGFMLTLPVAARLASLGIRHYQISLDGPRELHDTTRVRAHGDPSFDRIWGNLEAIRASNIELDLVLRLHLTPANLPYMADFVTQVRETFLRDSRFRVFFKAVERLGGPNNDQILTIGRRSASQAIRELVEIAGKEKHVSLGDDFGVCYASRPNSLVIRANGLVSKCTVALADSANSVGHLQSDGAVLIDSDKLRPWVRGWDSGDLAALRCPLEQLPR